MIPERRMVRGIALISVMVVVSVVAASAAHLLYRQNIDIERSARIMSREQAFLFAFGLETYARALLGGDNHKRDYYFDFWSYNKEEGIKDEYWSWPIPNSEMSDEWLETFSRVGIAHIEARIRDLSGLFNLNNVYYFAAKGANPRKEWLYEQMFKNLVKESFGSVDDPPDADALWDALLDWFDNNDESRSASAEDDEYLHRTPPYLTGQGRMAWPEEIRLVKGFDGRVADRLLPLLSALPSPDYVRMNINTAESQLLRYVPDFAGSGLAETVRDRLAEKNGHFGDQGNWQSAGRIWSQRVAEIFAVEVLGKPNNRDKPKNFIDFFDVKSDFFLFSACVRFGRDDRPIEIQSVLHREKIDKGKDKRRDKVVVMQRRMVTGYRTEGKCK